MNEKKLIVNADDFGQSPGINEGIIRAHEQGIVTSTSLMVRYPYAKEAALFANTHPALGVGLHVDLGEWTYANGGWAAVYEVVDIKNAKAVRNEIITQLESFNKLMNKKPTHLDSHQHVHLQKTIQPVFFEIARELNINLRHCSKKVKYCGNFYGQTIDGLSNPVAISVDSLIKVIQEIPAGVTELACHPGLHTDVETMYKNERAIEVESLCDSRVKDIIQFKGIERCNFNGIGFQ